MNVPTEVIKQEKHSARSRRWRPKKGPKVPGNPETEVISTARLLQSLQIADQPARAPVIVTSNPTAPVSSVVPLPASKDNRAASARPAARRTHRGNNRAGPSRYGGSRRQGVERFSPGDSRRGPFARTCLANEPDYRRLRRIPFSHNQCARVTQVEIANRARIVGIEAACPDVLTKQSYGYTILPDGTHSLDITYLRALSDEISLNNLHNFAVPGFGYVTTTSSVVGHGSVELVDEPLALRSDWVIKRILDMHFKIGGTFDLLSYTPSPVCVDAGVCDLIGELANIRPSRETRRSDVFGFPRGATSETVVRELRELMPSFSVSEDDSAYLRSIGIIQESFDLVPSEIGSTLTCKLTSTRSEHLVFSSFECESAYMFYARECDVVFVASLNHPKHLAGIRNYVRPDGGWNIVRSPQLSELSDIPEHTIVLCPDTPDHGEMYVNTFADLGRRAGFIRIFGDLEVAVLHSLFVDRSVGYVLK